MKLNVLFSEARARIIWGESCSSVRDFLISNGISAADADAKIETFFKERNTELRKMGIRNILVGVVLVPGAGIAVFLCLRPGNSSGFARSAAFCMLGVFYGIWKLYTGIIYFVFPRSEHRSIPDIVESDILD